MSHRIRDRRNLNLRRKAYRPLVERLEDRLPPGDAVFAGLLAHGFIAGRAAGLVPADVTAAPPGQARRLAEAAPFELPAGLVWLGNRAAPARPVAPAELNAQYSVLSTQYSAFGENPGLRTPAHPPLASPVASAPGEGSAPSSVLGPSSSAHGALTQPRSPSTPADYQLDQAVVALGLPPATGARAGGVQALFDLGHPTTGPFPSNWFTVFDDTQNTWRRVNLPYPDCAVYVSDCRDVAVLNELDGFNLQPRLSVPFSGPIDVDSVNYSNVFLVSLGSTTDEEGYMPRGYGVGINQVVWDVETNTLHVESDELLAQHTRFALYVTTGVRDAQGNPVGATEAFRTFRETVEGDYREHLHDAMLMAGAVGYRERDIAVASVFTTQSTTAVLEKMRDQIKAETPEPADFLLGTKGERTVFNLNDVAAIVWRQHTGVNPPSFATANVNLGLLRNIVPGAVGSLAFGKYTSPDYMVHPGEYIPAVETRSGIPVVQGSNEIYFNLVLPSGPKPEGGWPVAIAGHGGTVTKNVFLFNHAAVNAAHGIATIGINTVGHGYGPLGTLTMNPFSGGPLELPGGGRSFDQNGDNVIGVNEGVSATVPRVLTVYRDGHRQMVADLMQLVRVLEVGVDVDGDGSRELDPSRISFYGQSIGGNYGTVFVAVEPAVRAGILNVPVASLADFLRLSGNRVGRGNHLRARIPSLLNPPGVTYLESVAQAAPYFHENLPPRDGATLTVRLEDDSVHTLRSPLVNTVAGANAIQQLFDRNEWATNAGDALAYARHLRKQPLAGMPAKSVIVQFAKGDQGVPNPTTSALIRAGDLSDRATYYRHDLAFAENPLMLPRDPHGFLNAIGSPTALYAQISRGIQNQIAAFFASDGKTIIHPEPARFFEVPIKGPLPEDLNYIP